MKHVLLTVLLLSGVLLISSCTKDPDDTSDSIPQWFEDADQDGLGDPHISVAAERQPEGYVLNSDDGDDTDPENRLARDYDPDRVRYSSTIKRTILVLKSFERETTWALDRYMDEDCISHQQVPQGKDDMMAAIENGDWEGSRVDILRIYKSDDFVIAHSRWRQEESDQVSFDVFRFERNRIVEHWDNITEFNGVSDENGHTQVDGERALSDFDKTRANISRTEKFVQEVYVEGQWSNHSMYLAEDLIQHSPMLPNGTEPYQQMTDGEPMYAAIKFIHGKGNFVLAMSEGLPTEDGQVLAYFDLYRMADDLIVEHWDVVTDITPLEVWDNPNGKWGDLALDAEEEEEEEDVDGEVEPEEEDNGGL